MTTIPASDSEIFFFTPKQFDALMGEDRQNACVAPSSMLSSQRPWNAREPLATPRTALPPVGPNPITAFNPLRPIDSANEWLKDNTNVDMFGWKGVISDSRTAIRQVTLLGIMGDAYLTHTRAGNEAVVFRGRPGLRSKLPGTRYLRDNPIIREAGFVIGHKEMLKAAGKSVKIGLVCFVAWDIVHELLQDRPSMTALGVTILSDIFQAMVSTAIGVAVGMFIGLALGGVVITFVFATAVTTLAGAGLSFLDSKYQLTNRAIDIAKRTDPEKILCGIKYYAEEMGRSYISSQSLPITYMSF